MSYRIKRGDQFTKSIIFTNGKTGNPIDLTGTTLFLTIRAESTIDEPDDTNALIQKTRSSHDDPTNGITSIQLLETDTNQPPGTYIRELQIKFPNGDIRSTETATVEILQDVTKRTS